MAVASNVDSSLVGEEEIIFRQNFERNMPRDGVIALRLTCTTCNINIQHRLVTRRNVHIDLSVMVCNRCSHRIRFTRREAKDKVCEWCVRDNLLSSDLMSCKQCSRKFCRRCVMTNKGTTRCNNWTCFKCNLKPIWQLRALCSAAVAYSERLKTELDERRARVRQSLSSSRAAATHTVHISPLVTATFSPSRTENRRATIHSSSGNLSISMTQTVSVTLTPLRTSIANSNPVVTTASSKAPESVPKKLFSPKNKDGEDQSNCVICLDKKPQIACIPCGHLCLCEFCLPQFERNFHRCPLCNKFCADTLKIFW